MDLYTKLLSKIQEKLQETFPNIFHMFFESWAFLNLKILNLWNPGTLDILEFDFLKL